MPRYNNADIGLWFHDMEIIRRISTVVAPTPLVGFYGIKVFIDPAVPPLEVHVRSNDGRLLEVIPLTKKKDENAT